ncbi:hypothetical protein BB559_004697 [Furculomyces boomerangus]|uniref:Peptide hydrolase n=2 Tax=Harpellales TaxID=61421 RepID=A0A2T9YD98_9FUNG|nr:hypothetical protein BB559_004697 [Furculomyces boomerangus]PWA03050.1 hypothetical protein BB558_000791 [Smittium angustum]
MKFLNVLYFILPAATTLHSVQASSQKPFSLNGLLSQINEFGKNIDTDLASILDSQAKSWYGFDNEKRLIRTGESVEPVWMERKQISKLIREKVNFMDITDAQELETSAFSKPNNDVEFPKQLKNQNIVRKVNTKLSAEFAETKLTTFTGFRTRYYNSDYGRDAAMWLKDQIQEIIDTGKAGNTVSVSAFQHRFQQPSVIARFEGSGANKTQVLIVTAHLDSINQWIPWIGRSPGADDNGSGTVTILDAFRVLVQTGFAPRRTVEFHWYAGEEGGLLGSQDVAKKYLLDNINMIGQLHFDMTGYYKGDEVFGLVTDNVNDSLVDFIRLLVGEYSRLKTQNLKCGYACSDHASWFKAGYRSAMAFESGDMNANKFIHTPNDTVDTLDFNHIIEFSKIAVAFCLEMGL